MDCRTVVNELPAYSLGALDGPERSAVARHLQVCLTCRAEFEQLLSQVSSLALLAPQVQPPPHLEQQVLRAAIGAPRPRSAAQTGHAAWRTFQRWSNRLSLALAAAALAFAGVMSSMLLRSNSQLAAQLREQQAVTAALQARIAEMDQVMELIVAPDARVFDMQGTEAAQQARGRCYVSPKLGMGWLYVEKLRPLPAGRVYQLWLLFDGERISGGTFKVDPSGFASLLFRVPGRLAMYSGVGITEEPEGGSPGPTTPRLLGAYLPLLDALAPAQQAEPVQYDH